MTIGRLCYRTLSTSGFERDARSITRRNEAFDATRLGPTAVYQRGEVAMSPILGTLNILLVFVGVNHILFKQLWPHVPMWAFVRIFCSKSYVRCPPVSTSA